MKPSIWFKVIVIVWWKIHRNPHQLPSSHLNDLDINFHITFAMSRGKLRWFLQALMYINIVVNTTKLKITPDPFLPEEFANYHGTRGRWHQWQPSCWCWWRLDGKGAPCRTAQLRTWQRCQSLKGNCSMRYHFVFGRLIGISLGGIFTYLGPHSCGLLLVQRPPSMPSQTLSC